MKGIDISQWQGAVDFAKVKSAVDFVILREGYRNAVDTRFMEYAKGAKAAGIPIVGVYHFIYATNTASAKVEANSCVAHVKAAGLSKDVVIWADLEYDTVTKAKNAGVTLTAQMQREITIAFCEEIKRLGYPTGIYANDDYLKNIYGASISKQYDIWLADYYGSPDYDCVYHQTGSTGRVNGINGNVDTDVFIGKYTAGTAKVDMDGKDSSITTPPTVSQRDIFVAQLQAWIGKNEYDGSFKTIIDTYNSGLQKAVGVWGTRNVKMLYSWPWCACTVSAAAIAAGLDSIVPIEISCPYMIIMAQKHGIWVESDAYVPQKGDIVLYDWQDNGVGDNRGEADHVGVVESVNGKDMVIIEGNYSDSVKRRPLKVDGRYIRGYIVPKFTSTAGQSITYTQKSVEEVAREVLAGKWGNGDARKAALTQAGYDYSAVQAMVNQLVKGTTATAQPTPQPTQTTTAKREVKATAAAQSFSKSLAGRYTVTASALNMRKGAGTGYGVMVSLPRGTAVQCYGYYTSVGGVKWLYVQATYNGTSYIGFCSSAYLKR